MTNAIRQTIFASIVGLALLATGCSQIEGGAPQASCSFVQNKNLQRVSWKSDLPLKFRVHKNVPKEAYGSILKAASQWNSISTKKVISVIRWDAEGSPENGYSDGAPTIYWLKTWEGDRSTEQARTTVVWSKNKIKDSDIRINAKNFKFSYSNEEFSGSKVDFVSLIVHEMGHALGFAHSEEKESVMYPLLAKGRDRRKVRLLSDLEAYSCEYGDAIVKPAALVAAQATEVGEDDEEGLTQADEEDVASTETGDDEGGSEESTSASSI